MKLLKKVFSEIRRNFVTMLPKGKKPHLSKASGG